MLLERLRQDDRRPAEGKEISIGEAWKQERGRLLPLPPLPLLDNRVAGEAPLLPEVEDEGADGVGGEVGGVVGQTLGVEEAQEVDHRRSGGADGAGALAFGGAGQLEALQQAVDVLIFWLGVLK